MPGNPAQPESNKRTRRGPPGFVSTRVWPFLILYLRQAESPQNEGMTKYLDAITCCWHRNDSSSGSVFPCSVFPNFLHVKPIFKMTAPVYAQHDLVDWSERHTIHAPIVSAQPG